MGLLGILTLSPVSPRCIWNQLLAVELSGLGPSGIYGLLGERRGVGSHISDVALLVELLRKVHGLLCTQRELP